MAGQGQELPESFKFEQFGGMLPAWDDTLVPPGQATDALNAYLLSGALAGWRKPKLLYTLQSGTSKFAYRLPTISESVASAVLYMLDTPGEGFTVTLGEETYTFASAIGAGSDAYQVLIGANAAEAISNLYRAVTLDGGANTGAGTYYGVGTYANPAVNTSTTTFAIDTPRLHAFAPSSGAAYNSTRVETSSAAVAEWRTTGNVATDYFTGGTNLSFDSAITGTSTWIEFDDPDTDVVRSPVVEDEYDRYYFASPSIAPRYNTRDRIEAGASHWLLGVPAPNCAPGVTVAGGGDDVVLGDDTAVIGGAQGLLNNTVYLVPVTPEGAVSLNDVSFLPQVTTTGVRFAAVLYDDNAGVPSTLLNVGAVMSQDLTIDTIATSSFVNPTGLLANTQYWIGIMIDTDITVYRSDGTSSGVSFVNTFDNGPPATVGSYSSGVATLVVYGNGTSDDVLSARSYVYTYETAYGEESAPSPATVESGWSNGTWTIELFTPPPDQMGVTRNITKVNLYRSITSQAGATTYFFVATMPVGTASYVDNISDDIVITQEELLSQLWTPPPPDLLGFVSMPNGMIAGWRANEIWFCEPYRPHAWPSSYVLTTEFPIVGLGVSGSALVAATSGPPYVANGVSPGQMSAVRSGVSEPCTSRGSIIGADEGVYFSSPNGLILVTQYGAVRNTTAKWITREKWQQLTPQKNLRAVFLVGGYFALGCVRNGDTSVAQEGFTAELIQYEADQNVAGLQPARHRPGFSRLSAPNGFNVDNVRIDPWSAVCIVIQNGGVYYYDFADEAPEMQTYVWRSKKFQQKSKKNFAAMRFWFSIPDGTPELNATRLEEPTDAAVWDSLPADRYGFIRVYAGNNELVTTREIRQPQEMLRILSGFKHETWQFEIEARVPISNFQIATSSKAMAKT